MPRPRIASREPRDPGCPCLPKAQRPFPLPSLGPAIPGHAGSKKEPSWGRSSCRLRHGFSTISRSPTVNTKNRGRSRAHWSRERAVQWSGPGCPATWIFCVWDALHVEVQVPRFRASSAETTGWLQCIPHSRGGCRVAPGPLSKHLTGWKELFHQTARPTTHRPCIAVNHSEHLTSGALPRQEGNFGRSPKQATKTPEK